MSYIFKFKNSDKVTNYVKTYPKVSFSIYSGSAWLNNNYNLVGNFTASTRGVPNGYISLHEKNIDREGSIKDSSLSVGQPDLFKEAVDNNVPPTNYYDGSNPTIKSFMVKNGTRLNFRTVSTAEYDSTPLGQVFTGSSHYSASIHKFYYSATDPKYSDSYALGLTSITGTVSYLYALTNTMDHYQYLSPHYAVSSSLLQRDITSSVVDAGATAAGLVTIPSVTYGDTIKKGSIDLKFFVTGTLVGQLKDERRNGDLIQVGPPGSAYSGSVAGVALYNEGFLVLTGSWDLSSPTNTQDYGTDFDYPAWVNFAQPLSESAPTSPQSSFALDFKGEHTIPVLTLFASAPKNYLNHSNNTTYRDYNSELYYSSGSTGYVQNSQALIKNTVSSSYNDPTGSFKKTTYITTIGIYDGSKNLIGIAKVSKPVKKTEERDLVFKLKLDI